MAEAYSFERGELTAMGRIFLVSEVEFDQPTERQWEESTSSSPGDSTVGVMGPGKGKLKMKEKDRLAFITALGPAYREKRWSVFWVLRAAGEPDIRIECTKCGITNNQISHKVKELLAGDIEFDFQNHTINGMSPHSA